MVNIINDGSSIRSPYEALASVGISPRSSLKQIMDASFDLMAQGLMTPEVRVAWDALRIKQSRLLVDAFYQAASTSAENAEQLKQTVEDYLQNDRYVPDISALLDLDTADLRLMNQEYRELVLPNVSVTLIEGFEGDAGISAAELIEYDR